MLESGALRRSQLQAEIELGYFRPSLLAEIDETPHRDGWRQAAADRYAEIDRRAGFVKHAEVHRRRRARAAAIKQYDSQRRLRRG